MEVNPTTEELERLENENFREFPIEGQVNHLLKEIQALRRQMDGIMALNEKMVVALIGRD